ncbi:hypothetical protein IQ269_06255 [Tychonema sp. LEGE 07199]|uniref:hypothetical protein n=1 Tax=unclassified Tychonema TaxID=2642144 RepID=UPI0018809FC5|nr:MULTISPECIES: hypothetical protein [unclassified Tychonema]MBE9120421.1 hypothetical protein [Tychonema sp. LEGE 07199]MBE9131714.1 hypothetical protein [Tychonema sp. LEGE 07196]
MKYFFIFLVALFLSGGLAVTHASSEVFASINMRAVKTTELTSVQLTDTNNSVEVDGVIFETVVPNQVVTIPENMPDIKTPWQFGIRITNKTSLPIRFNKYHLTPEFLGLNDKFLLMEGIIISLIPLSERDFPLVQPGKSFTVFWEGEFYWNENRLLFGVFDRSTGRSLSGTFSPGTYHVRLNYENANTEISYVDLKNGQRGQLKGIVKGLFSTPWVEIKLVSS